MSTFLGRLPVLQSVKKSHLVFEQDECSGGGSSTSTVQPPQRAEKPSAPGAGLLVRVGVFDFHSEERQVICLSLL